METVLVTGTSSGIGRATALHLSEQGYRVLAGVRDTADGESLRAEASGPGELHPVQLDITDAAAIESAVATAKDLTDEDGLVGVVNNAGQPVTGPMEVLPIDEFRRELEVNLLGQLAVSQAFLPMLRASEGRLVFVTSIGGRIVLPFAGAYHASKFALEAVAEALRQELRGTGVEVVAVEPGITDSEIWDKGDEQARELIAGLPAPQRNLYEEDLAKFRDRLQDQAEGGNMSPTDVAETIEKALTSRKPSARYPVGAGAKVAAAVRPFVPDRIYSAIAKRPFGG